MLYWVVLVLLTTEFVIMVDSRDTFLLLYSLFIDGFQVLRPEIKYIFSGVQDIKFGGY